MNTAIIVSKKDIAGMNIKKCLLELFDFKANGTFEGNEVFEHSSFKLYTLNDETINSDNLDKKIEAGLFVFATRHKSASGKRCLCVHAPGNWGKAEMGGKDRQLGVAAAGMIKQALIELSKQPVEVAQEVTHHGPLISKPCFFIEIGSSEADWVKKEQAEIIARTIMKLAGTKTSFKTAIGIGGQHYSDILKKINLETNYAIGHICPKYALKELDEEMIKQAVSRNEMQAVAAIVDWKGLGAEKQKIAGLLDKLKLNCIRAGSLRKQ